MSGCEQVLLLIKTPDVPEYESGDSQSLNEWCSLPRAQLPLRQDQYEIIITIRWRINEKPDTATT